MICFLTLVSDKLHYYISNLSIRISDLSIRCQDVCYATYKTAVMESRYFPNDN